MTAPSTQNLLPIVFNAPLVNPSPLGLYPATVFTQETGAPRWLASGVQIRTHNFGGEDAFGIWTAPWCGDELKTGTRPGQTNPFDPLTVWAYDECDLTEPNQAEVRTRAAQNLRIVEPVAVEREFSTRLLADAGTPATVPDLVSAVAYLEAEFAKTNTTGMIHAGAQWAAPAAQANLMISSGGVAPRTPLGHTWVFGGGYVLGLGASLIATSPTFGWRDTPEIRETIDAAHNRFLAIAERSVVIGYEHAIGAATIT